MERSKNLPHNGSFQEDQMNLNVIITFAPLLVQGMLMTLKLWIGAAIISMIIGLIFGIFRSRRVRMPYVSSLLDGITCILRGVPFYVQLLMIYFVLPDIVNINISPSLAGIISLGFCSAAYVSQMVRGSIDAISDEQWEAAWVLGLTTSQTLWYVILPQALRTIVPTLCGELDMILKSTSVVSTLGVLELTGAGRNIIATDMQVVTVYCTIALLYLFISSLLNAGFGLIERKLRYDSQ